MKIRIVFSKILLSLRKKKLAKITEKRPIVKLLKVPITPFKISGMLLNPILENILLEIVFLSKIELFQPMNSFICELKIKNLLSSSSTFNKDRLSPCFEIRGTNNDIIPMIIPAKKNRVIVAAKSEENFNFLSRNRTIGLPMSAKTAAIER